MISHKAKTKKESGFSLIELMVALVIGLLLLAGVLNVFVGSRVTYSMQTGLAKLQENGRFAMSFIADDIRQAGFRGCSSFSSLTNVVRDASNAIPSFLNLSTELEGRNNMDGVTGFNRVPLAGTDVIETKFTDQSNSCDITSYDSGTNTFTCAANHSYQRGDVLLATDCKHSAIFQQTNDNLTFDSDKIEHDQGGAVTPGNCTDMLGPTGDDNVSVVPCDAPQPYPFENGSVMKMQSYRYYVSDNNFGEPALYRERVLSGTVASAAVTAVRADELVEGIEDMQILYGVDTSLNSNGSANLYVPYDQVSDPSDIVSVRVSFLVRSIENNLVQGTQTVQFNGTEQSFNDGFLRKVFTSTVTLRNPK